MNVSLTPELENLVNQKVKTGLYNSASEVVREALRLLEEHDRIKEMRREELRAEIQKGMDDIAAGRFVTLETEEDYENWAESVKREGRRRMEERRNGKS